MCSAPRSAAATLPSWPPKCAARCSRRRPARRCRWTAAMNALSDTGEAVETLRWREGRLELIDQRVLPNRFEYVSCASAVEVAAAIRSMVVRGAPAIGCAAAFGIALDANRIARGENRIAPDAMLDAAFDVLAKSRPTAVNLFWALDRMRKRLSASGPGALEAEALAMLQEDL